jgi:hypothetical protein
MMAHHRTTMRCCQSAKEKEYNEGERRNRIVPGAPSRVTCLRRHNDRIQRYLERAKGGFLVLTRLRTRPTFERLFQLALRKKKGHRGAYEFCRDGA